MYSVSSAFKTEILKPSRTFECRVTIGTKVYTNVDVISINIDGNLQGSSSYTIGNAISQSCDIVFRNNGNVVIDSSTVNVEIGLFVNGAFEYIQMGVFNIDDYSQSDFTITIKCFDNMIKFEKKFTTAITGKGILASALLNEVITQTGVSLDSSIISIDILVPTKEYTCREMVSYIASALGLNAIITRSGKLKFIGLASSGATITTGNYFKFELDKNQFSIKKLTCKAENSELTLGTTTDTTMELKIENPLMTTDAMTIAYNAVSAISFMGYLSKWQGNLALDLGDIITITDTKSVSRNVPILYQKLTYTGGLTSDISAKGENKIANSYSSYGKQYYDMSRLQKDTGNLRNDITVLGSDTNTLKSDTATLKSETVDLQDKMLISFLQSGSNLITNGEFSIYEDTYVSTLTGVKTGNPNDGLRKTFLGWDALGGSMTWWKISQGKIDTAFVSQMFKLTFGSTYVGGSGSGSGYDCLSQIIEYPYGESDVLLSFLSRYGYSGGYDCYLYGINSSGTLINLSYHVIDEPSRDIIRKRQVVFHIPSGIVKLSLKFGISDEFLLACVSLTNGVATYKQSPADTKKAIADVATNVDKKVDKVAGKGLSTNDYSGVEQTKLASVATGATKVASSTTSGSIKINDVETSVVAINSTTPTYTESSSLETINTGEYLTIAFGKIKKAINSLIGHIADGVAHITSTERTSWNAKLDKSGGTITGDVNFTNTSMSSLPGHFYHDTNLGYGANIFQHFYAKGGNGASASFANQRVWDGAGGFKALKFGGDGTITWNDNNIYHVGNKPSLADLGAAPKGFGLGDYLLNVQTVDSNNTTKTGMYYNGPGDPNKPPGVEDGALFVLGFNEAWVNQMYLDWRTNKTYRRAKTNGIWCAWQELAIVGRAPTVYAPALQNSWVNNASTTVNVGYYKTIENVVFLRGLIKNGTTANPTLLFTLLEGFRPAIMVVTFAKSTNGTAIAEAQINIMTDGKVYLNTNSGYNTSLCLEGINFPTF